MWTAAKVKLHPHSPPGNDRYNSPYLEAAAALPVTKAEMQLTEVLPPERAACLKTGSCHVSEDPFPQLNHTKRLPSSVSPFVVTELQIAVFPAVWFLCSYANFSLMQAH